MNNVVKVGMADLNIVSAPNSIRTSGLGSCVGVCLYDPIHHIAGLAHVMLPSSDLAKQGQMNVAKYADTAIPALIKLLQERGGRVSNFQAKLAGGAQMFVFKSTSDVMRIGSRNVEACKLQLHAYRIPIIAEDTGGNCGRTIEMFALDGLLHIRTVNQGTKKV